MIASPPTVKPLVSIRNVRVERGGNYILRGVNADIKRGSITALIGLNGSGKTTLLRALVKEYSYTGEITFHCGHDHSQHEPNHVGYVPQKLNIEQRFPLTVRELFALTLQRKPLFLGISKKVNRMVEALLAPVGGTKLIDRPVTEISGGELQRVLLALALEPQPELLLLDEPAAGVDFADQQGFYDLIGELNRKQGITILLVSHDLSMVPRHAHHVLCLEDGLIACEGPPQEILTTEMLEKTFGSNKRLYLHSHDHCDHDHGDNHGHHPGCGH